MGDVVESISMIVLKASGTGEIAQWIKSLYKLVDLPRTHAELYCRAGLQSRYSYGEM